MLNILFDDFETLGPDLSVIGGMNYVTDPRTRVLIYAYAFNDEEPELWFPGDPLPQRVVDHIKNGGYRVSWNAAFDRLIWQFVAENDHGFPRCPIDQTLDAMVQAQASNLPGSLDQAAKAVGKTLKQANGKALIRMFCDIAAPASPEDYPEQWQEFCEYALDDIRSMRDVWQACRQLTAEEWQQYWASERINDRGFEIDVDMCRNAARFYAIDKEMSAEEAARLTDGEIPKLTLTQRINRYVYDHLPPGLGAAMVKEYDEETGEPIKLSLRKDALHMLLEDIEHSEEPVDDQLVEFLELMEHARSSSALKFSKMANQQCDGRLYGSYVFNGAGQTGRFSSRVVQVHNLVRDRLKRDGKVVEAEVYNMIAEAEIAA